MRARRCTAGFLAVALLKVESVASRYTKGMLRKDCYGILVAAMDTVQLPEKAPRLRSAVVFAGGLGVVSSLG